MQGSTSPQPLPSCSPLAAPSPKGNTWLLSGHDSCLKGTTLFPGARSPHSPSQALVSPGSHDSIPERADELLKVTGKVVSDLGLLHLVQASAYLPHPFLTFHKHIPGLCSVPGAALGSAVGTDRSLCFLPSKTFIQLGWQTPKQTRLADI